MKKILFIGDSLVEFFDWNARFPGHDIANLGRAGETVEGLLSRLGGMIRKHFSPDLIFIMTGINNVAMEDFDFLGSYRKILEELSASYPQSRIFIHSLLPTLLPWVGNSSIQEVNRSLAQMAEENGAGYIDLYRRFVDEKGVPVKDYLRPDGVHLSEEGYAVWAEALKGMVKQKA
jgi:lysophospholipase L1-like esterase